MDVVDSGLTRNEVLDERQQGFQNSCPGLLIQRSIGVECCDHIWESLSLEGSQ
jgi:hypothetical protein